MTDENGSPPDGDGLPCRPVTVNQVVAWNLAYYRRAAGMTQAEMGEAIGWTKSAVSDAERSWNGKWTREFDAQILTVIACALGVPVGALFLPPADDRTAALYYVEIPGPGGCPARLDMDGLTAMMLPDHGGDGPAMDAYKDRLRAEVGSRFDEFWKNQIARWLEEAGGPELRDDFAARIRMRRDQLLAMAAEEAAWADAVEKGARR